MSGEERQFVPSPRRGFIRGRARARGGFRIGTRPVCTKGPQRRNTWTTLRPDLLQQILSYCPDDPQCRLVCKSWKKSYDNIHKRLPIIKSDSDDSSTQTNQATSWDSRRGPSRSFARKRANFLNRTKDVVDLIEENKMRSASSYLCTLMNEAQISESMIDTMEDIVMDRIEITTKNLSQKYIAHSTALNISNILSSCDTDDLEEKREFVSPLFHAKYPNQTWSIWSTEDKEGIVFGWADTVFLYIVGDHPKLFVVEICSTFTRAQFSILQRRIMLYQKKTGRTIKKVIVYSALINDEALTFNEKMNIELLVQPLV